jgi:2-polyprenyl-3-methyl-5-hydroxy-6-metoxy-1,4-benzoquinol methylase
MSDAGRLVALQRTLYQSRNPTRRYLHCLRREWVQQQIAATGDVALALEVGPGSGVYLPALASRAAQVVAIDREPAYLTAARDWLRDKPAAQRVCVVEADVCASPLPAGSVDLLLCSEVLEHVSDSPGMLQALAALLKPDGRMLLTTPQPASPLEVLGKVAFLPPILPLLRWVYREPVEPTGHINLMGRRELEAQIHAAGLRICEREVFGLYLPLIAEFGGRPGQRLLEWLDRRLRGSVLQCLLWTQCYRLERVRGGLGERQREAECEAQRGTTGQTTDRSHRQHFGLFCHSPTTTINARGPTAGRATVRRLP